MIRLALGLCSVKRNFPGHRAHGGLIDGGGGRGGLTCGRLFGGRLFLLGTPGERYDEERGRDQNQFSVGHVKCLSHEFSSRRSMMLRSSERTGKRGVPASRISLGRRLRARAGFGRDGGGTVHRGLQHGRAHSHQLALLLRRNLEQVADQQFRLVLVIALEDAPASGRRRRSGQPAAGTSRRAWRCRD